MVVHYVEMRDLNFEKRDRAYLVYQNLAKIEAGRRPAFENPRIVKRLKPIPLLPGTAEVVSTDDDGLRAVLAEDRVHFTLVSRNREISTFALPDYVGTDKRAQQVFLTPLAVTRDLIIVGAALGSVFGIVWFVAACAEGKTVDSHWKP